MKRSYTDNQLKKAVKSSTSIRQVLLKLQLADKGGNYKTIQRNIKRLNLSTSHLGDYRQGLTPFEHKPAERVFCVNSTFSSSQLRKRIIQQNLVPYICKICANDGNWLERSLVLQLDHIDGDRWNNKLTNLRFLCPNCHSQTETYCRSRK